MGGGTHWVALGWDSGEGLQTPADRRPTFSWLGPIRAGWGMAGARGWPGPALEARVRPALRSRCAISGLQSTGLGVPRAPRRGVKVTPGSLAKPPPPSIPSSLSSRGSQVLERGGRAAVGSGAPAILGSAPPHSLTPAASTARSDSAASGHLLPATGIKQHPGLCPPSPSSSKNSDPAVLSGLRA